MSIRNTAVGASSEAERYDRFIPIGKRRYGVLPNWPDKKYIKGRSEFGGGDLGPSKIAGKAMLAVGAICFVSALVVAIVYALQSSDDESGKSKY